MAAEIPDYSIGEKGVQLTGSPLHTPDGGLLRGENVEFQRLEAMGGIASRRGLLPLNASDLGSIINHIANLPFPFPSENVMMVALSVAETNAWLRTTDGTTYEELSAAILPRSLRMTKFIANVSASLHAGNLYMPQRTASYRRRIYYASDDYDVWYSGIPTPATRPPVEQFDGDLGLEVFRMTDNPTATVGSLPYWVIGMWVFSRLMWFCVYDPGGVAPDLKGRVLTLDPENGAIALVGNRFGNGTGENTKGMPYCLASFAGKMFCGTMGISGNPAGGVYSILPGVDATWTLDRALAVDDGYVMDMIVFQGQLYIATSCDASGTARVDVRSPTGTWSVSFTAPATNVAYCGGFVEFGGNLYVCFYGPNGGTKYALIKKFDGTTWTTEFDVATTYGTTVHGPGTPMVFGGNLFWPFNDTTSDGNLTGFLLRRTAAGTWSKVLNNRGIRGALGFYRGDVAPSPVPPLGGGFSSGFSGGFA